MTQKHDSQPSNAPAGPKAKARPFILLAEDDEELRWALSQVLQQLGWEVHEASDGAALLEAISAAVFEGRAPMPDVIVTDIRMPGFNGLNIVEGLRELGATMPIVVMSAYGDDEIRARVRRWGGTDFLDKPIDVNRLERTLRQWL